jgi:thiamine pyrophosphokinase
MAIVSSTERIEIVGSKRILEDRKGATVSLLSTGEHARVTLKGFEYPLKDEIIRRGDSLGISNIVNSERAEIDLREGKLLMIIQEDRK